MKHFASTFRSELTGEIRVAVSRVDFELRAPGGGGCLVRGANWGYTFSFQMMLWSSCTSLIFPFWSKEVGPFGPKEKVNFLDFDEIFLFFFGS